MRLNSKEIEIIKEVIPQYIKSAKVYLFGSRLDDTKKGGDIDLFIVSPTKSYAIKIKIRAKLKQLLGKPVDIVFHRDFNRAIEKEALKGVELLSPIN
jgi:predicted nucleotidyltransferase